MDKKKLMDWMRGQPEEIRSASRQVLDAFYQAEKSPRTVSTLFLSPDVISTARGMEVHFPSVDVMAYPDGAERQILILGPAPEHAMDVTILEVQAQEPLSHRALLGSILGTGIVRDRVGDILFEENRAEIMVKESVADYLCEQLTQVGRASVQVRALDQKAFTIAPKEPTEVLINVSSPRLDAIAAQLMHTARDKAQDKIRKGDVKVNHRFCYDVKKPLQEGDILSIRGAGRFSVLEYLGTTKKGNARYRCAKYE